MAIRVTCTGCGISFMTSVTGSWMCDDCNGTNERKRQEQLAWGMMSIEERVELLKSRLDDLASNMNRDWRLG